VAGRELVLNGRGIHVRGQAGNGREAIGADVTRTAEALKIPVFHPHELRHTVAGLAITSGADVKVVQPMLGHKSATMRVRRARPPLWRPTRCCGRCHGLGEGLSALWCPLCTTGEVIELRRDAK
jgi:Phage integrase family